MEYRLVSEHTEDLDDGRTLEPGQFVDLEDEDFEMDRLAALRDEGKLVSLDSFEEPNATEAAIAAAKENDVNLVEVGGTGAGGRITVDDVNAFVRSREEGGETE